MSKTEMGGIALSSPPLPVEPPLVITQTMKNDARSINSQVIYNCIIMMEMYIN